MKYYRVVLSTKETFILDEQDFERLSAGLKTGSFVKMKKAIINPSFVVTVHPLSKRDAAEYESLNRPKIDGYIDEARGVYVMKEDKTPAVPGLPDEFAK